MVSSRMRSALPFKPTPSTCFPPPPPPVYPGYVPCLGYDWGQLASLRLTISGILAFSSPLTFIHDTAENIANVTRGPGSIAWTTTLNATTIQATTIGIMCYDTGYAGNQWFTMINGRFDMPTGPALNPRRYWNPIQNPFVDPSPPAKRIFWQYSGVGEFQPGHWYVNALEATLTEISAPPRSRPPYPMIPSIG